MVDNTNPAICRSARINLNIFHSLKASKGCDVYVLSGEMVMQVLCNSKEESVVRKMKARGVTDAQFCPQTDIKAQEDSTGHYRISKEVTSLCFEAMMILATDYIAGEVC
jgi:hypothetical protein